MSTAVYVDASAIVKLFVAEHGSELARESVLGPRAKISSRVIYTEVGRAIHRRIRNDAERADALADWEVLWEAFDVVEVDEHITRHALALAQFHGLGTLDAIHLASALRVPAAPMRFATWDSALADAAHAVGLRTIPDLGRSSRRVLSEADASIVADAEADADLLALARQTR